MKALQCPPRSEMIVEGRAIFSDLQSLRREHWLTEPRQCAEGVLTAGVVLRVKDSSSLPIRIMNLNEVPVELASGTALGTLRAAGEIKGLEGFADLSAEQDRRARLQVQIKELIDKVPPSVSVHDKSKLHRLLQEYEDILSVDDYDLGLTHLVQHSIDTGDERPVRQALRRTPVVHDQIINEHIGRMLEQGLIQPVQAE